MNDLEYPACINELYQSEVIGEAAFLALIKAARNERDNYHFAPLRFRPSGARLSGPGVNWRPS